MGLSREEIKALGKAAGEKVYTVFRCKAECDEKIIVREGENPEKAFEEQLKDLAGYHSRGACKELATGFKSYEEAEESEAYLDPPRAPAKRELTLLEIATILREKFGRDFRLRTEPLPFTAEYEARYDPDRDEVIVGRGLRGIHRLSTIAHEAGHKLAADEAKKEGKEYKKTRETALRVECDGWEQGLAAADVLGVRDYYVERWRRSIFPICVPCECPPPGDDKIACGKPFSVGDKPEDTYTGKQFIELLNEYKKTGKWSCPLKT